MADSRDMIVAHIFYRREIRSLAALVAGIAAGDRERAAVVADHLHFVVGLLHGHHRAEDRLVWPLLQERAPAALAPIVATMEFQHGALDAALQELEARSERWRLTADAAERDTLAGAAGDVYTALTEHLDLEEREVLSIIDEHLTDPEWAAVAAATGEKIAAPMMPVVMGMALYDANPEMERLLRAPIPDTTWVPFSGTARQAYADYSDRVFGTPVPPHYR